MTSHDAQAQAAVKDGGGSEVVKVSLAVEAAGPPALRLPTARCSESGCGETDPSKLIEIKTVYDVESGKTAPEYRCSRHVTFDKEPGTPTAGDGETYTFVEADPAIRERSDSDD